LKAILTNLSFGGMRLVFIGSFFDEETLALLKSGQRSLLVEFSPASTTTLRVLCRVQWFLKKTYLHTEMWVLGLEFITKTEELYRDIDHFFKSTSSKSEETHERRLFPRVPENGALQCSTSSINRYFFFPKYFEGILQNVSTTGMLIRVVLKKRNIEKIKSRKVTLKINFELPSFQRMQTGGSMVYMRPIRFDPESVILGIKFLDLCEKNQGLISEYVVAKRASFLKETL
jgi:hypothetical protein